jgi:TPR repeat protein
MRHFLDKNGLYVKKDLNKALKFYQKGYKYGNLAAPVGIAIIYRKQPLTKMLCLWMMTSLL